MSLQERIKQFVARAYAPDNLTTTPQKLAEAVALLQAIVDDNYLFEQEVSKWVIRMAMDKVLGDMMMPVVQGFIAQNKDSVQSVHLNDEQVWPETKL